MAKKNIWKHPVHLGLGSTAIAEPEFNGDLGWYMDYAARHKDDGAEGRLVTMHRFSEPWTSWEMHPHGSELVVCIEGQLVLHQETEDHGTKTILLDPGEYAINDPGVWHTADVNEEVTALFITAGMDTRHRSR